MKNFEYKGYFVILERQHNGSIRTVADNDSDTIRQVFYDYPLSYVYAKIKRDINYRLENNLQIR
jgi:hypothetical protein